MNSGSVSPQSTATTAGTSNSDCQRRTESRFQRDTGPSPIKGTSSAISGTKTALKYGGPTEYLPAPSASMISGNRVPNNTVIVATRNTTLLHSISDSRDTQSKLTRLLTAGARSAYKVSDPPTTSARNTRINRPRAGSVAKAWTEVSTPERTMKVPSRLREKAKMASSNVQLLNRPRFSVAASECSSAVPASQGMKEAFSTGSQNHQPPQPSS